LPDRPEIVRLDKWLWQARFFKTRALSAKAITSGHVRLDGTKILKSGKSVVAGQTVTFLQGSTVRVVRVLDLGTRRGPASEAQTLYVDIEDASARLSTALE
jgi:ribosome-associated heat shock protein Hsp15